MPDTPILLHRVHFANNALARNAVAIDIIVVGAGASGTIAATRFAEAGLKTLLLESGGPFFHRDGGQAIQDWQRAIDPNTNITRHDSMGFFTANLISGPGASAFYDPSVPALAPMGIGGGTGVNGAQQFWPPRRYLDNAFGFPGWTADDFQPALRRVERRIPTSPVISADGKFYGDEVYEILRPVWEGLNFTEVDTNVDVDAKYNTFGRDIFAVKDGLRGGPVVGYLQDAKRLPNFTLRPFSRVEAIMRDSRRPAAATGVRVNGTFIRGRNVVLAAGAWNTPTLLYRSGVGPEEELNTALSTGYTTVPKDQWVVNARVGRNLHDHPSTQVTIRFANASALPNNDLSGLFNGSLPRAELEEFLLRRSGRLTNFGRQQAAWLPIQDPADPDLEMIVQLICSTPTTIAGTFNCQFNLNEGMLTRGGITITPSGAIDNLGGSGPWLNDPEGKDLQLYTLAIQKFVDGVRSTPGFTVVTPASNVTTFEDFKAHLERNARRTNNHWGGGCSVGISAESACTDLNGKVFGTDNLFVVDGSLTPAPTTSNSAYLYEGVAELVSDKIIALIRR
ncbi:Cellobiose dehydrogenase [Sphaceloma murrayae]|uniref:Cellobiose dehydrogenase n=1 Tax=Sphaceloma murrayae TaxID=2082308 RepID=A0A2K1QXC9_9PEZI|nr:Cellobiose dehydrogenase [Sphaceloma murrayae]